MHLEPIFNDAPLDDFAGPWGTPGEIRRKQMTPGSLPVSEGIAKSVFWLPAFADPEPGLLEQYVEAFQKVVVNAHRLTAAGG
jgi:hypothetical protein